MAKLTQIEGIGNTLAGKFRKAGVGTTEKLLEMGAEREGRDRIAKAAGVDEKSMLRFVNYADLMRIKGVGGEFAELLEAAGVDSVPELAQRKPENLHTKMKEINESRRVVRRIPSTKVIRSWVDQARKMGSAVRH